MAIDSRLKRQSATCMLVPSMLSGVYPDTAGVVQAEWQAIAWMYSGITASVGAQWYDTIITGLELESGQHVTIQGRIRLRI